jgi:hypothetical protein
MTLVERRLATMEDRGMGKREGLSLVGQVVLGVVAFISAVGAVGGFVLHLR